MKKKKKMSLKQIILHKKEQMLPLNFFASYVLAPAYLAVLAIIITVFGILVSIDEEKYLVAGIVCLGFFAVLSVAVLLAVPYIKKEAIKTELTAITLKQETLKF